jgi:hypothetical protein
MSRRHHGGRPHRQNGHARGTAPLASTQASPHHAQPPPSAPPHGELDAARTAGGAAEPGLAQDQEHAAAPQPGPEPPRFAGQESSQAAPNGHDPSAAAAPGPPSSTGCTAPQLRRFIKSRPYVPMHELRRRFGINGSEDDVTLVVIEGGSVFVGLPAREGGLLGELLRGGEVGYELSLDPRSPVVVGLYPMRPVPRS